MWARKGVSLGISVDVLISFGSMGHKALRNTIPIHNIKIAWMMVVTSL